MEEEKEKLKQKPMMRYIVPFSFSDGYEKVYSVMQNKRSACEGCPFAGGLFCAIIGSFSRVTGAALADAPEEFSHPP